MTESHLLKRYKHLKSGRTYWVISENIINATNEQDGQKMVEYIGKKKDSDEEGRFVREADEFYEKFKPFANGD